MRPELPAEQGQAGEMMHGGFTTQFGGQGRLVYDGKRIRKPITRRNVDHAASMARYMEDYRSPERSLAADAFGALEPKPDYIINVPACARPEALIRAP